MKTKSKLAMGWMLVWLTLALAGGNAWATDTVLSDLTVNDGSTYTVGAGNTLTVGSGSGNRVYIASGGGTKGTLDVSQSAGFTANVGEFYIGTGGSGGYGTVMLGTNNTITAATMYAVGSSFWDWTGGTNTTAAGGITTIHTPDFRIGWAIANGTSSGTGLFTLGSGATLNLDGLSGGRASLIVGYDEEQYGRSSSGTMDLSAGTASLKLSSLMVGGQTGNGGTPGVLTMSSSSSNHLDISGTGTVVRIGYLGLFGGGGGGWGNGTVTIGNLDAASAITSTDNSTAIVLGERVATASGSTIGTLNLGGGTLTITTTGKAIGTAGSGGTSALNLNGGVTLKAGANSTNWISGLTTATITNSATFDSGGYAITIPQAFSGPGVLNKGGTGTVTLTGTNTYTGATTVNGGTLAIGSTGVINTSSGVSIGAGDFKFNSSSTALTAAPSFSGTGGALGGTGTITPAVTITSGNALAPGYNGGTLTLNGGLALNTGGNVRVEVPGSSKAQVNGDYADSLGAHTLMVSGTPTLNQTYSFLQWTGSHGSLPSGAQSNWALAPTISGVTANWIGTSLSDTWPTASSWMVVTGYTGTVNADLTGKTMDFNLTGQTGSNAVPSAINDTAIDPPTANIAITGSGSAVAVNSLRVGGANNSSPALTLGSGNLTVATTVNVLSNAALTATSGALIAPTLNVNGATAAVTLGHASGSVTTANVSAGTLTVNSGSVATANLSGTGSLAGSQAVPQVNVTGGTPAFSGSATAMTVSGGGVTTTGGSIGALTHAAGAGTSTIGAGTLVTTMTNLLGGTINFNSTQANGAMKLPSGSTATINVGTGAQVATADFSAGAGTANAANALTVSSQLKLGSVTVTAGATPFKASGANLVNQIDVLTLQGGTTTMSQSSGGYVAGLDIRAWQGISIIEGTTFNMPGSPNASTYASTIGYATGAINMSGNDQEHFTTTTSGVLTGPTPTGYKDNYTVEYRGKLYIASGGTYRFATTSDDGSALWIDQGDVATANPAYSAAAVQNNYPQGMTLRNSGQITLTTGYHDFIVRFNEGGGGNGLVVQWDPTGGTSWAVIPGANYYHGGVVIGVVNQPSTDVAVTSSSVLDLGYAGNATLGNLRLGGGSLTFQTATGVSANNIFATGNSSIAAGTPLSLRTGQVDVATSCTLTVDATIGDGTSPTSLTKTGAGALVLSAANTYTGPTTITDGSVTLSGSGAISANALTLAGGMLDLGGLSQTVGAVNITAAAGGGNTLQNGSLTGSSYTVSNATGNAIIAANLLANGSIGLSKAGAGTVTLSGINTYTGATVVNEGELDLNTTGAQAIAGNLTVNGGTAKLLQSDQINSGKNLVVNGGAFDVQGHNQSLANVSLITGSLNGSGGTLTSGNTFDLRSGTVSAILGGSVGLTKSTSGTVVMTGDSTFTGTTDVTGLLQLGNGGTSGSVAGDIWINADGVLAFNKSGSYATANMIGGFVGGQIQVQGGGTNDLNGDLSQFYGTLTASNATVSYNNADTQFGGLIVAGNGGTVGGTGAVNQVTVLAGGTYSPGNSPGTQTVTDLMLSNGATLKMELVQPDNYDQVIVQNSMDLQGTAYLQLALSNTAAFDNGTQFVLVDGSGAGGVWPDGAASYLTLLDVGGPDSLLSLTNNAEFYALGGGTFTNQFRITYDKLPNGDAGHDVILTVIPEPGTLQLLLFLGTALVMRRKLRCSDRKW